MAAATITILSCSKEKKEALKTKEDTKINGIYTLQPYDSNKSTLSQSKKQQIKDSMQYLYDKEFATNKFSGAVLVAQNGEIIYEKYDGMSDFKNKKTIDQNTPLHIASVSKVLTATATLLLIDSKKIQLDQKVNTILPDFPYEDITIRTLLNHRTGLRNYSYFVDKKEIWNKRDTLQNSDLIPIINKHNIQLEFKTGTRFSYCNTNYAILALIIEKITKMDYRTAMKKLIFKPLDMKNTFVFDMKKNGDTCSNSYKGNYIQYPLNHLDDIYGDKNIYSTVRDLLKFDMATYNPSFLNKNLLKEVYKGYSYESRGTRNYGLGIRLLEWEDGKQLFYHNGWWHGSTSAYVTMKKEKATLICISNKYTRKTYYMKLATGLFGDYPFHIRKKGEALLE
ncbi:beta-lactamase family protein [Flavobacterium amniphilum]|uniref:serine hydrolase domain-containing protein n=1 Tax=Flavobacterium amniphilum TaxID=1834035 RepID=UPI00202A278C|nr:serine hydrolase domain-containing protein [Flavobacterium amniphilum]MCL9806605.1 beta-lactamase family protein [Flavobacterium amniphilum]